MIFLFYKFSILFYCLFSYLTLKGNIQSPRVIWHSDPSTQAIISWTNSDKNADDKIYIHSMKYKIEQNTPKTEYEIFKHTRSIIEEHKLNHVYLNNLIPNKYYYFKIKNKKEETRTFYFKTAHKKNRNFKLIFGGDSRTDHKKRILMNLRIRSLFENNSSILAFVHGGDFISQGHLFSLWKKWFLDYEKTMTNDGRLLPIIPTRGNHEYDENIFNKIFANPGHSKSYYLMNINNFSLFVLNTVISTAGEQKAWLKEKLQNQSLSSRWIIANYHRPAWPAVKLAGSALTQWVPYFEMFGVDLVFESDGHVLKKTVPIKNKKRNDLSGIIYVGEGGLGVPQRTPKKRWYLENPGYAVSKDHVQLLSITDNYLNYEVILIDGSIYDSMKLFPRSHNPFIKKIIYKKLQNGLIFNQNTNSCLQAYKKNKKIFAIHDLCPINNKENYLHVYTKKQLSKIYFLNKENKKFCLEKTKNDLLLNRYQLEFSSCESNKKEQFFYIERSKENNFQIKDFSKSQCINFSQTLKLDSKFFVYIKNCKKISSINSFEFHEKKSIIQ